jgi:hypothetical protein
LIKIKVNSRDVMKTLDILKQAPAKARLSACNKTAAQGLTFAKKEIRQDYGVTASALNKNMKIHKAKENTPADITAYNKGMGLKNFSARQVKIGVSVMVKKGQRKIIRSAFGPKINRLGKNVFVRETEKRYPIKKLVGPGAAKMFGSKKIMTSTKTWINQNFRRIFEHELKYFSGKILK